MTTSVILERARTNTTGVAGIRSISPNRQRVYIFPTAQGWIYALMLIVMLLGAINYNNSMAFMLCFLLAGLGIICMLHTYRNLTGVLVTITPPEPVFAGQPALFPVQLDNIGGQLRPAITIRRKREKNDKNSPENRFINLDADRITSINYPVTTRHRGTIKAGRLIIETCFPLGIFRAWAYLESNEKGLVYPRPAGEKRLPVKRLQQDEQDYGHAAGTDDFAGFRKYRPGDAIKSIAWKAFAREQGLLIKQFSGKGSKNLILDWEDVAYMNDVESRLSQLCLWIVMAEETGIPYGLELPDVQIEPGLGEAHYHHCLEKLARFGVAGE